MPRLLPAVLLLAAVLAAGPGSSARPVRDFTAERLPLAGPAPDLGGAEVLGILRLGASGQRWFGGLSGMVLEDGHVVAVNDSGHWVRFRLDLDAEGRPQGAGDLSIAPLAGLDGSKDDGDAEEIIATPEGMVVSFERRHRLLLYRHGLSAPPERLAAPDGMDRLPANGGAEALTRLADGRLLILAEEGGAETSPGWIGRPGAWQALRWRRVGDFRPTAAATLPGGDVLVLERSFSLLAGVAVRLVRVPAGEVRPGATVSGHEVFRLSPPLPIDNFEALAVRRRPDGRVAAYLLSDDNFSPLQATLLLGVVLP